jgi:hypothetical protein
MPNSRRHRLKQASPRVTDSLASRLRCHLGRWWRRPPHEPFPLNGLLQIHTVVPRQQQHVAEHVGQFAPEDLLDLLRRVALAPSLTGAHEESLSQLAHLFLQLEQEPSGIPCDPMPARIAMRDFFGVIRQPQQIHGSQPKDVPPPEPDSARSHGSADHAVEADLALPSGKLSVTGATELRDQVEPLPLPPGRYRVQVVYEPTHLRPTRYNPDDAGDHIEYQISMWPTGQETGVRVLKQGRSPWAY